MCFQVVKEVVAYRSSTALTWLSLSLQIKSKTIKQFLSLCSSQQLNVNVPIRVYSIYTVPILLASGFTSQVKLYSTLLGHEP